MPQTGNRKLVRDLNQSPIGKGSVFNSVLDISFATRRRADKANEGEAAKFQMVTKVMDRFQHSQDILKTRAIERMSKTLKDIQAYKEVVNKEYNVDNFDTIKFGFKTKTMRRTPESLRRFKFETRIYNSGFSMKTLRPEVERKLKEMDPVTQKCEFKEKLLQACRRQSENTIDRTIPTSAIFRERRRAKSLGGLNEMALTSEGLEPKPQPKPNNGTVSQDLDELSVGGDKLNQSNEKGSPDSTSEKPLVRSHKKRSVYIPTPAVVANKQSPGTLNAPEQQKGDHNLKRTAGYKSLPNILQTSMEPSGTELFIEEVQKVNS